jgi:hypothetical protein
MDVGEEPLTLSGQDAAWQARRAVIEALVMEAPINKVMDSSY